MRQLFCFLLVTMALQAQPPRGGRGPIQGPMERFAAQAPFNNNCASCHKNTKSSADEGALKETNAPSTDTLATMTPEAIYAALTTGAMVQQASKLSDPPASPSMTIRTTGWMRLRSMCGQARNRSSRSIEAPASA